MNMSFQQIVRTPGFALLLIAIGVAVVIPSSPARAQFEDVDADVDIHNPLHRHGHFEISERQFDQSIFGRNINEKQHRERLDAMVSLQLTRYNTTCNLSPKQQDLLRLAAGGDVKRLEDTIRVARAKFNIARFDQNKFNKVWQGIQPLRTKIQNGIFDESSLLHKVVPGILDEKQLDKFKEADVKRLKFIYRAKIGLFLSQIQNGVPMLADQRSRLETLLLEETPTPKKYGQYAYHIVMINVSKVPEEKMKEIFDDAQWKAMKQLCSQGRGMERRLIQQGFRSE
jgi:hypothetical protein